MQSIKTLAIAGLVLALAAPAVAEETRTVEFGDAQVVYDYQSTATGMAILTLIALVPETNNALRGLKNSDRRRLGKLGQLLYQCKLMLYKPAGKSAGAEAQDPFLISKNYSLFTGVDLSLDTDERMGIRIEALGAVDDASLFSSSLGERDTRRDVWETVGDGSPLDLRQFNINVLKESDLVEKSESIDIVVRFPVFQLQKPVRQWSYNFRLADFKRAVHHTDENCTPATLMEIADKHS